jgi:hypothetical protein
VRRFATMPGMGTLLDEASKWVKDNAPDGVICPCCQQVAKVYRRKLNRAMAYALIVLHRLHDEADEVGWLDVPRLLAKHGLVTVLRSREYQKLCYWGLLETKGEKREDGGKAGKYRFTAMGHMFVANKLAVPRHMLIYNGVVLEIDRSEMVTIREALGDKFGYDELMAERGEILAQASG